VTATFPVWSASLRPLAEHEGGRVHIDTLKVPHHDSDHNIPRELLQLIDCRRYLISTSGARHSAIRHGCCRA
jgi:hypothetical protein